MMQRQIELQEMYQTKISDLTNQSQNHQNHVPAFIEDRVYMGGGDSDEEEKEGNEEQK